MKGGVSGRVKHKKEGNVQRGARAVCKRTMAREKEDA